MLIPCALLILWLLPVALRAEPCSVPKYQYSKIIITTAKIAETIIDCGILPRVTYRPVSPNLKDVFADISIILRLIEYSPSCVKIPARIAGIPSFVCKKPVIVPAITPARTATNRQAHIGIPASLSITVTAPPVANVPSTERSATSSILKVI